MKCSYASCKNEPKYVLLHHFNNDVTYCCENHAPKWAKNGKPPVINGVQYYAVEKVQPCNT